MDYIRVLSLMDNHIIEYHSIFVSINCVRIKKEPTVFWQYFDRFGELFIIFGRTHTYWKIIKSPINTRMTLCNDDVIVTSLKNAVFSRRKRNARIQSASTVASKFAEFKSSWLQSVKHTATEGVQNTHSWSRRPQAPHKNWVNYAGSHCHWAAVHQWHRRLSACVKASSGHFEDCFWCNVHQR